MGLNASISLGKSSFISGSELCEDHFDSLLALVKGYVVNIWEACKLMVMTHPSLCPQARIWEMLLGLRGTVA